VPTLAFSGGVDLVTDRDVVDAAVLKCGDRGTGVPLRHKSDIYASTALPEVRRYNAWPLDRSIGGSVS